MAKPEPPLDYSAPADRLLADVDAFLTLGAKLHKRVNAEKTRSPSGEEAARLHELFDAIRSAPARIRAPYSTTSPFGVLEALKDLDAWVARFLEHFGPESDPSSLAHYVKRAGKPEALGAALLDNPEERHAHASYAENTLAQPNASPLERADAERMIRDGDCLATWRIVLSTFANTAGSRADREALAEILARLPASAPAEAEATEHEIVVGPDYAYVKVEGRTFQVRPSERECIKPYFEELRAGGRAELDDRAVLSRARRNTVELRAVFKDGELWGQLVVQVYDANGKRVNGRHRLALPEGSRFVDLSGQTGNPG